MRQNLSSDGLCETELSHGAALAVTAACRLSAGAPRPAPLNFSENPPEKASLPPPERRLSSRTTNPAPHSGQLISRHILSAVPITAGGAVPVLVAQEPVGAVSQSAGAAARRLAALDPLANEMNALAVPGRDP